MPDNKRVAILLLIVCLAVAIPVLLFAGPEYKDGSYTATYTENGLGSLTVTVIINNGAIAHIDFPEGTDDIDMPQDIFRKYIEALRQAPAVMEVDVISGATTSCNLLKSAIFEALLKAVQD